MPKEQLDTKVQAIVEEIKKNPQAFMISKAELKELIQQREELDRELKEKGLTVI